jgi:hypothetical protein
MVSTAAWVLYIWIEASNFTFVLRITQLAGLFNTIEQNAFSKI